ncbi:MAG: InlB B-repeat-containing protein [Lachnospiraceae bacterium]|nr:InlB B-repeat-containing protein [Lachnospiraceae bacterium]
MKKRQRRIAALLLACAVASVPVSQAFAETAYDVAAGVDAQILFPKDSLTNIAGAVTVDGAEAAADENGSWTNTDDAKVYRATLSEDGTLQITAVGYVLDVEHGTSKNADENTETAGQHYQFGDWEKPETPTDRAYYAQGDTVKLKADDPADGMEFKEWKCDTEGVTIADPTSPETTFTMPDKKVTITAEYQEKQEAVTETQTEATTEQQTETAAEVQTEAPAESQTETGANGDAGTQTENPDVVITPEENTPETLPATGESQPVDVSAPETYMVTVNNGQVSGDFTFGSTMTVTANDRTSEGYQFSGWYVDSMNASLDDATAMEAHFTMPNADVTLTATYTEIQTDASEAQTEAQTETTAQTETAAQEPQTTAPEVQTETQTTAPEPQTEQQTAAPETTQTEAPVEIETQGATETNATDAAVQTESDAEKYAVTVTNDGIGSGEYQAGETVTVEAPAENADGQMFDSWTVEQADVALADPAQEVTTFVMPQEAVTVTPVYTAQRTVTVDENTTVAPTVEELKTTAAGSAVTVTAKDLTASNQVFAGWTAEASKAGQPVGVVFADATAATTTFTLPDCDTLNIHANYKTKTYKVTVANGLINNASTELDCEPDTSITVTANPGPEGQTFSKWVINDGAYDIGDAAYEQTIWLTVKDQDLNIRAEYEGIQYAVTVKDGTANYEKCVSGVGVTLTANKAPDGYEFDYWSVDTQNASLADAYSASTTFTMPASDVTVSAHYKQIAYTVSVENGSADQQSYHAGDQVTIQSNYPASGREFSKWESVSGNVSFADGSRWKTTFTMPAGNVSVRATYKDGPSTDDNTILDLVAGGQYYTGETIKFTASGAGMSNSNPNPGDYRYRPSGYQIGNVTGTLQSPYSVSMAINATGEYTLKVTYNKDVYDGNSWVSDGTADTKTVTFKVITKAAGVQTGDETPIATVVALAVVSCAVFIILLVVFIRRRKK